MNAFATLTDQLIDAWRNLAVTVNPAQRITTPRQAATHISDQFRYDDPKDLDYELVRGIVIGFLLTSLAPFGDIWDRAIVIAEEFMVALDVD